jgi:hypothetical protein
MISVEKQTRRQTMAKRKISQGINVRINVGNYQHIELSQYAEEEIEYHAEEDREKAEAELHDDLVSSLISNMRRIPEQLGKTTNAIQHVEESIQKAIPEWLENNAEPNIAKKKDVQVQAANKDSNDRIDAMAEKALSDDEDAPVAVSSAGVDTLDDEEEDLFS